MFFITFYQVHHHEKNVKILWEVCFRKFEGLITQSQINETSSRTSHQASTYLPTRINNDACCQFHFVFNDDNQTFLLASAWNVLISRLIIDQDIAYKRMNSHFLYRGINLNSFYRLYLRFALFSLAKIPIFVKIRARKLTPCLDLGHCSCIETSVLI